MDDEKTRRVEKDGAYTVYTSRWYVIMMVSMANIVNNYIWASWGPISQSAKLVYGWTNNTLFWIVNFGNIAGFVTTLLGCYLVDVKGIRVAMITCTIFMALSATTRIITTDQTPATILISIGQALNGIATSVTMTIPPAVSEVWFHANERTTATAVSALSGALGAAASYLLGPHMVSMPAMNGTTVLLNETDEGLIRREMKNLNYITFSIAVVLMILCLLHLPAKPPSAPSKSSTASRYNFKKGVINIIRNPWVWYIVILYAVPAAVNGTWSTLLDVILSPLGITQTEAGWMGFYAGLAGVIAGLVMGRCADIFKKRMKLIIMINFTLASAAIIWFACMCNDILPRSQALLYTAVIISQTFVSSCMPLFLEIMCETSHPIAEGVTSGLQGMFVNLSATVFLLIHMIPNIGTAWMNWTVCGVFIATVPLMAVFKVDYKRMNIDTNLSWNVKTGFKVERENLNMSVIS